MTAPGARPSMSPTRSQPPDTPMTAPWSSKGVGSAALADGSLDSVRISGIKFLAPLSGIN
ncbi:hypothetical protein PIB30_041792 [Stylosanthes scabra]|uniref:Uncharacterized protein n=1 Tax=Stylosanthes scabra TaxID=79078 RepID=A0ABU6WDE5_9FABA|nr:hypothetical protein [Stylosanthes scabra]